jgi:hypothetical protein
MNPGLKLRADKLVWRKIEDEVVVLDTKTSLYLALNKSGALVWPLLAEGTTRDLLVEHLVGQYDVAPSVATRDIDAFLASVRDAGLREPPDPE